MRSVLIVDDEANVIQGLIDHVPWDKLQLHIQATASHGEEALSKIRVHPPDIVITDVYMPKMDGMQLIKVLREEFPSIYIIIHSGYDDFDNARLAMRFGVQHFFLKPSTVTEIESVMREIIQDMDVQEKQQKLLERYDEQQKDYLAYSKDAFIRDILTTRYREEDILAEKLELLQLKPYTHVLAASLSLIRPPYLTKSRERDWQLMKFGAGNIIEELIAGEAVSEAIDIHAIDYSDSTFVLVFFASDEHRNLPQISISITQSIVDHILLYLKLSSTVGIGRMKIGVHEMISSYLESQRALEAAEYQEINKVFTYEEVHGKPQSDSLQYPLDMLKEIHLAIYQKDYDQLSGIWDRFEQALSSDAPPPLFILQNMCISTVSAMMTENYSSLQLSDGAPTMAGMVKQIYSQPSVRDLFSWMREQLQAWQGLMKEELTSSKSHTLIRQVKEHVHNYYDQEITLAEIADSLYVNRNYLSQLFKRVTGETFVNFLNKFRIEKAKERLREKHYMVYEVSEMVGYQNPTYFSQVFKSITGVSPSEFYK
jgi:two-component system response regulator YesN